jgi:hypothetical protein
VCSSTMRLYSPYGLLGDRAKHVYFAQLRYVAEPLCRPFLKLVAKRFGRFEISHLIGQPPSTRYKATS